MTQGTSQTVNFDYDTTRYVLIGGSFDGQFLATGDGCSVTAASTTAAANPVNASTITSITFAPVVAVCGQVSLPAGAPRTADTALSKHEKACGQGQALHNGMLLLVMLLAMTTICVLQFTDNSVGDLSLIAFDTATQATTEAGYTVYACKFTLTFTLVPESTATVDPSQLFPEANAADPLPGSFLKVMSVSG